MKSYEMQVLVEKVWMSVRPTGSEPYRYRTRDQAWTEVQKWYLCDPAELRVIEVSLPPNMS